MIFLKIWTLCRAYMEFRVGLMLLFFKAIVGVVGIFSRAHTRNVKVLFYCYSAIARKALCVFCPLCPLFVYKSYVSTRHKTPYMTTTLPIRSLN